MAFPKINWTRLAWAAGLLVFIELAGLFAATVLPGWLAIYGIAALGAGAYVVWEETAARSE